MCGFSHIRSWFVQSSTLKWKNWNPVNPSPSAVLIMQDKPFQSLTTTEGQIVGSDAVIRFCLLEEKGQSCILLPTFVCTSYDRFLANESGKLLAKSIFDKSAVDEV